MNKDERKEVFDIDFTLKKDMLIKGCKNLLFDIQVNRYFLETFSGKDFESFDDLGAKLFGKDFDKELVNDIIKNLNRYLNIKRCLF